jgi:hypothetical protein
VFVRRIWLTLAWVIAVGFFAEGAQAADRIYQATYEGSYSYKATQTGSSGTSKYTDTLSWSMKIYYEFPGGAITRSLVAQGSHVSVNTGSFAGNDYNCTLRRAPAANVPITLFIGDTADEVNVGAQIPASASQGGQLTSTGTGNCALTDLRGGTEADGSQQTGSCASFPPTTSFELAQGVQNAPADGYTKKIDLDQTATPEGGCQNGSTFTASRSIHARIIVGTGGRPVSPPDRALAARRRQKAFAENDLFTQLLRAEGPCGYVAIGAGTAVWSSVVGGPTASAALIPAEFLVSAGTPLCAAYVKQIVRDVEIANDPPAGNINAIARPAKTPSSAAAARKLPSCDGKPADLQSFCQALRAALADQIAAAQRSAAIAGALLTTVDRETKAHKTHHAAALRRQSKAGDRFVTDLNAAERDEHAIGARIAALISAQNVTGQFTTDQDAKAIAAILRKLRAHHVSRSTVQRLARPALTAGPYDLLANMR